jgi:hypothetical protein
MTATWNSPWATPGGDFGPEVSGTTLSTDVRGQWIDFDVTAAAKGWLANPSTNDGVLLALNDPGSGGYAWVNAMSKDSSDATLRPKLTVVYSASANIVYGDATGDGGFSLADINQMVDWLLGRSAPPASGSAKFTACDVNGDGKIDLADLNLFVDKLLGRITKFPVEP